MSVHPEKTSAARHYTSLPACRKSTFAPMKNRTDPKNDRVFKHIFHNHPRALMHLLNSFLLLTHPIVDLEYMPEELHDDLGEGRLGIVDVRCRDSLGRSCIVEIRKWLKLGNFDKGDVRHAWMLFFTQPDAMKQVYTPEERAKLEEMFEAVDAWDLTRHTENELWVMDKKIDIMLTKELVAEVSFEEGREIGKQEGLGLGKSQVLEALLALKSQPDLSDEDLKEKFGLSTEDILLLRSMV
jgi:hypothetical protein